MKLQVHRFLAKNVVEHLGTAHIPDGANTMALTLKNRGVADLMTVFIDDQPIAKAVANETSCFGNAQTHYLYLPTLQGGEHRVAISIEDPVYVDDVEFLTGNPWEETEKNVYPPVRKTNTELMTATDMLGRKLPGAAETKPEDAKKQVAIVYWTWREAFSHLTPRSLREILKKYPEAEFNIDHPIWTKRDHVHWTEPMYGFYRNTDSYVIRKHAIMLADAGIDLVMMDCTNGSFLWMDSLFAVLKGFDEARRDGINVPKFALILNFGPIPPTERSLRGIYQHLYKPGKFKNLWYMWEGKPLILAYPNAIWDVGINDFDTAQIKEIKEFFTFRYPQPAYEGGETGPMYWGWLERAPQNEYGKRPDGTCEMMTAGVAQNSRDGRICTFFNDKDTYGRSYTKANKHALLTEDSYLYGYNFQEQWDNVLASKPDLVFVTGWNEWTMGKSRDKHWLIDPSKTSQIAFVDQYDLEHSRDIEPDKDGYKDTYYLQLVSNIRRFKGLARAQEPVQSLTITSMDDWKKVTREYISHRGSCPHRDSMGMGTYYYENRTGRNNIIAAKVTYDKENVYFYAQTDLPFVGQDTQDFMVLLLDIDRDQKTGWEGYDIFVKNGVLVYNGEEHEVKREIGKREISITIPRIYFPKLDFEFKWTDHVPETDIMRYYQDGDTAPNGRFNFVFTAEE